MNKCSICLTVTATSKYIATGKCQMGCHTVVVITKYIKTNKCGECLIIVVFSKYETNYCLMRML